MSSARPLSVLDVASDVAITSILLLDDDVELADTLKAILESRNFVVTTARNGVEGLREVMGMDFDVIICDLAMPTMPGDMFYLAVRQVKPWLCKRFLFVTGHGSESRINDFLHKTDGLAVFKPVPAEELVQMISLVLKRNEQP
jgi:DNA-binding response OmpR family regulator